MGKILTLYGGGGDIFAEDFSVEFKKISSFKPSFVLTISSPYDGGLSIIKTLFLLSTASISD
jgi:hypothetical protein